MARLWYGGDPATFAIAKGTAGQAIQGGGLGTLALLPEATATFTVWDSPTGGTQITDLLNESGGAITTVSSSTASDTLGAIRPFQGPDGYEDDLWLAGAGGFRYRVPPYTETLFDRVSVLEGDVGTLVTTDLDDWSPSAPTDGQFAKFITGTGKWTPSAGPTLATVDWADITNKPAIPDSADDIGAIPTTEKAAASGVATLDGSTKVPIAQVPTGTSGTQVALGNHAHTFTSSALPAGSVMFADGVSTARPTARTDIMVIWTASSQPTNALNNVDIWLNIP